MKKLIALVLTLAMVLAFVACSQNETQETAPTEDTNTNDVTTEDTTTEDGTTEDATTEDTTTDEGTTATGTVGETLLADFKANHTGTAEEIASRVISNSIIQFMSGTMPVEEGLLSGFDNFEVKGFKEGAMFGPMMGSIAFVGYIFVLEDGADVEAFKTSLKENANLRWQICVQADELVVENEGNVVFFLMCPSTFETPDMPSDDMGLEDEIPAFDGEIPAFDGEVPAYDGEAAVDGEVVVEGEATTEDAVVLA